MSQTRSTMLRLGYLGLIPFAFGLLLILLDAQFFSLGGEQLFVSYSVVILSFLSGVLWGRAIDYPEQSLSRKALLLSNVFLLIAWAALLQGAGSTSLTIIVLAAGYIAVWFSEYQLRPQPQNQLPEGYMGMRGILTSSVVLMHGVALLG